MERDLRESAARSRGGRYIKGPRQAADHHALQGTRREERVDVLARLAAEQRRRVRADGLAQRLAAARVAARDAHARRRIVSTDAGKQAGSARERGLPVQVVGDIHDQTAHDREHAADGKLGPEPLSSVLRQVRKVLPVRELVAYSAPRRARTP